MTKRHFAVFVFLMGLVGCQTTTTQSVSRNATPSSGQIRIDYPNILQMSYDELYDYEVDQRLNRSVGARLTHLCGGSFKPIDKSTGYHSGGYTIRKYRAYKKKLPAVQKCWVENFEPVAAERNVEIIYYDQLVQGRPLTNSKYDKLLGSFKALRKIDYEIKMAQGLLKSTMNAESFIEARINGGKEIRRDHLNSLVNAAGRAMGNANANSTMLKSMGLSPTTQASYSNLNTSLSSGQYYITTMSPQEVDKILNRYSTTVNNGTITLTQTEYERVEYETRTPEESGFISAEEYNRRRAAAAAKARAERVIKPCPNNVKTCTIPA